jgi:hypothetical protein
MISVQKNASCRFEPVAFREVKRANQQTPTNDIYYNNGTDG